MGEGEGEGEEGEGGGVEIFEPQKIFFRYQNLYMTLF